MKKSKILFIVFYIVTILLLCAMCAHVAYSYRGMICAINHTGTSFPASVAFLLAIPYGIGIAISALFSWLFYRKTKNAFK